MDDELALFQGRELARGMPAVTGLALLSSRALAGLCKPPAELGRQAEAILALAAERGLIELRIQPDRIDSSERLLAVAVEISGEERKVLRKTGDPAWTMGFVEGLRQLCLGGLVVHLAGHEFVLSAAGFEKARALDRNGFAADVAGGFDEEI